MPSRLPPEFHTALAALTTAYTIYLLDPDRPCEALDLVRTATDELLRTIDAAHQRQRAGSPAPHAPRGGYA